MKVVFQTLEDEKVTLNVLKTEVVVRIKQKIRDNLSCPKNINIKLMKLKYNNTLLNDNEFLLSKVEEGATVTFEPYSEIEARNDIILLFQGDMPERQILQLPKTAKISEVKVALDKLQVIEKFDLYKYSSELQIDDTIEQCGLDDYNRINVVREEIENDEQLALQNRLKDIFKGQPDEFFKRKTQQRFRRKNDYILLFNEKRHQRNPFIYRFIDLEHSFITPLKIPDVKIDNEPFDTGMYSEIYKARDEIKNRAMVLKRYISDDEELIVKYETLINGMIDFQKKDIHGRFVKLYSFHRNPCSFAIGMEWMEGGSMDNYVQNFWPFTEEQVIRWTHQILNGLHFLHNNGVMFRDLKPSNVLLDENNNTKLCAFSLSMFLMSKPEMELKRSSSQSKVGVYSYMAPEVLNSEPYDNAADVWSFGAVLVNLITGKNPCPDKDPIDAAFHVARKKEMEYTLPENTNEVLKNIIIKCAQGDPKDRPKIITLIEEDLPKIPIRL